MLETGKLQFTKRKQLAPTRYETAEQAFNLSSLPPGGFKNFLYNKDTTLSLKTLAYSFEICFVSPLEFQSLRDFISRLKRVENYCA